MRSIRVVKARVAKHLLLPDSGVPRCEVETVIYATLEAFRIENGSQSLSGASAKQIFAGGALARDVLLQLTLSRMRSDPLALRSAKTILVVHSGT